MVKFHRLSVVFTLLALSFLVMSFPIQAAEQITLRVLTWANPDNIEPVIQSFQKANPNVKVELLYEASDDSYYDKLKTMIAGGVAPDAFLLPYERIPEYASNKLLLDLTNMASADKSFQTFKKDYMQFLLDGYTYQGRFYGLAWAFNPFLLYYNVNLFDAAGLAYPDKAMNWNDFMQTARKLTKKNGDQTTNWGFTWNWRWMEWVWQNGGDILDSTGTKSVINSPQTIEALQFIQDMLHRSQVAPSPSLGLNLEQLFRDGKAAMHTSGGWQIRNYNNGVIKADWGVGRLPKQATEASIAFFDGHVAYAGTKHPTEAWELIKFIAGPAGQEVIGSGNYLTVPVLRSIANKAMPSDKNLATKLKARLAQAEVSRLMPVHPRQSSLNEAMGDIQQVFDNTASPGQVVQSIHERLTVMLSGK